MSRPAPETGFADGLPISTDPRGWSGPFSGGGADADAGAAPIGAYPSFERDPYNISNAPDAGIVFHDELPPAMTGSGTGEADIYHSPGLLPFHEQLGFDNGMAIPAGGRAAYFDPNFAWEPRGAAGPGAGVAEPSANVMHMPSPRMVSGIRNFEPMIATWETYGLEAGKKPTGTDAAGEGAGQMSKEAEDSAGLDPQKQTRLSRNNNDVGSRNMRVTTSRENNVGPSNPPPHNSVFAIEEDDYGQEGPHLSAQPRKKNLAGTNKTSKPGTSASQPAQQPPPSPGTQRERNRAAAVKCRERSKAAVAELEVKEREMSRQNTELWTTIKALRDEVIALKNEVLRHGDCDCEVIQRYLKDAARNIIDGGSGSATSVLTSSAGESSRSSQEASRRSISSSAASSSTHARK